MTPEQLQNVKEGSVIHARLTVIAYDWTKKERNICAWSEGCTGRIWLKPDEIVYVLPRPLEAGDRVRLRGEILAEPMTGVVIAVHGDEVWSLWSNGNSSVDPLSDLQRVEDADRKAKEG